MASSQPSPARREPVPKSIGFIGSGQMAEALARGFIRKGVSSADRMICTDPSDSRVKIFESFGIRAATSNTDLARNADIILVAVKPQYVRQVLTEIRPALTQRHSIVSIAAGVTLQTLQEAAGPGIRCVRVMPNTPCLVGESAAAMCLGDHATSEDESDVKALFGSVGKIFTCGENLLSAVTGLSGSGPAYIFLIIEALADGGVRAGMPRDMALTLAAQTVVGSARMVLETGTHPGALKDMVASPGGTTIAGLHELEKGGLRGTLMNAVVAATQRANELSKM